MSVEIKPKSNPVTFHFTDNPHPFVKPVSESETLLRFSKGWEWSEEDGEGHVSATNFRNPLVAEYWGEQLRVQAKRVFFKNLRNRHGYSILEPQDVAQHLYQTLLASPKLTKGDLDGHENFPAFIGQACVNSIKSIFQNDQVYQVAVAGVLKNSKGEVIARFFETVMSDEVINGGFESESDFLETVQSGEDSDAVVVEDRDRFRDRQEFVEEFDKLSQTEKEMYQLHYINEESAKASAKVLGMRDEDFKKRFESLRGKLDRRIRARLAKKV